MWRLDTPSKGVFFAHGKWPTQVGRRPISIIVTQKRGPVAAPSQYLLSDHQARAQRIWQITPWLTQVLCVCVCVCVCVKSLQLCLTLCNPMDWSLPASLSMGFPGQEYWSGLPCPPPGDLASPGINLSLLPLLHQRVGSLLLGPPEIPGLP